MYLADYLIKRVVVIEFSTSISTMLIIYPFIALAIHYFDGDVCFFPILFFHFKGFKHAIFPFPKLNKDSITF